jgi:hypothetical protein
VNCNRQQEDECELSAKETFQENHTLAAAAGLIILRNVYQFAFPVLPIPDNKDTTL